MKQHARVFLVLAAVAGCGGGDTGDTPTFEEVSDLFTRRCSDPVCHSSVGSPPAGQLDLAPEVMCENLINVAAVEVPTEVRLVPGDADASYLMCKLRPDCDRRPPGSLVMPIGTSGLPEADILRVAEWIDRGAPGCPAPDAQAPAFAGATVATPSPSAITVEWAAATDDVSAANQITYLVYQAETSGGQDFAAPAATSDPGATSVTVAGLAPETTYYFVVRARDRAGNTDTNTVEVSATTPAGGDEVAPTFAGAQSATPLSGSSVTVSWQAASDDISPANQLRYRVYVAETSGGQDYGAPRLETPAGAATAIVSGFSANTTYYVVVRAVDQAGNEDANTVEISVTTGNPVSFSGQVQPIFTASCTGTACHDSTLPALSLDLTAGNAYAGLVDVTSAQCGDRSLVAGGDPGASYLVDKLLGINLCTGTKMPKTGTLTPEEVQLIIDWVSEGATDN